MSLFNWLFGVGDTVQDRDGKTGKVKGFGKEGMVDVKDSKTGKTQSKFGGSLKKVDTKRR